jgi:hypothetical protein
VSPSVSPSVSAVVTLVTVSVEFGAAPGCTGTVFATVHVSGGPVTVRVAENATDSANVHTGQTREYTFHGTGRQLHTMMFGTVDGLHDGTVSVRTSTPNVRGTSQQWTTPAACRPGYALSGAAVAETCPGSMISGSVAVHTYNNPGPITYTIALMNGTTELTSQNQTINPNSTYIWTVAPQSAPGGPPNYYYVVTTMPPTGPGQKVTPTAPAPCGP